MERRTATVSAGLALCLLLVAGIPAWGHAQPREALAEEPLAFACAHAFDDERGIERCAESARRAGIHAPQVIGECLEWFDEPEQTLACIRDAAFDFGSPDGSVAEACEAVFSDPGESGRCMRWLLAVRRGGGAIVRACGHALRGSVARLECIELAGRAKEKGAALVSACARHFLMDAAELSCLRSAALAARGAASLVPACKGAFRTIERELVCMEAAAPLRWRAAETVRACATVFVADDDELRCIRAVRFLRRQAPVMVGLCASRHGYRNKRMSCLEG